MNKVLNSQIKALLTVWKQWAQCLLTELSCTGLSAGGELDKTETERERNTDLISNGAQEGCTGDKFSC